jgi:hypothetical protein
LIACLSPAKQAALAGKSGSQIISEKDRVEFAKMTGFQILDKQLLSDDQVMFEIYTEGLDQTQKIVLQRIGSEWKFSDHPRM